MSERASERMSSAERASEALVRSKRMSERCERTSERMSEWLNILRIDFVVILLNVRTSNSPAYFPIWIPIKSFPLLCLNFDLPEA